PFWVWLGGGGALAVVAVGGLFALGNQQPSGLPEAGAGLEGLVIFPDPGAGHAEGEIDYPSDAPIGGTHSPTWQNCGIYSEPVAVEQVIHSLEHGAVWVAYRPDLPDEQVEILRDAVRRERSRRGPLIILAPKPDLQDPIVASAWRVQLRLENASDARLPLFLGQYQKGPFTPEPAARCSGGVGNPS
ncbi:MAG: DUF3105 domain-containing protein, partial [Anaerolineae bacterium]